MEFLTKNSLDLDSGKKIIAKNFANWTSGNEMIDNIIQKKQLNYNDSESGCGAVFEWIPYSELFDIKKIGNNSLATAIWKEGSLHYCENEWIRISYEKVVYDSRYILEFINKDISYTDKKYGLSQNPGTNEYIFVFPKIILDCVVKNAVKSIKIDRINGVKHAK
ncbi:unnamed protein product [Rhizophagus irregularis]|nr:unnamed protein product [Rhizophagus irregularis]